MKVGETIKLKGYITQLHFVRGRKGLQLEKLLGFKAGRLNMGWAMLYLTKLPKPSDFQFRGYTQMSGGVSQGHLDNPLDRRTAEKRLEDDNYDVVKLKEWIIRDVFSVSGSKRLVKIVPNPDGKRRTNKDYPPGKGIPQWELITRMPFKVAAVMLPGEVQWQK